MDIKVGFEIAHTAVQATPMVIMLSIHPSRRADIIGSRDLIRVAVAREPGQAIPLHGTYLGSADAFVGMDVSINVVSVGEEAKV